MKKIFLTTSLMFAFVGLAQAELAAPTLLKPDNSANFPLKKVEKFTWQKVTGASKYRIIFSNDKSFSNYDANKFKCLNAKTCFVYATTSLYYKVQASNAMLKTDNNFYVYFWQVQSVNSKDRSQIATPTTEAGEVRSFSVGTSSAYTKIANDGSALPKTAKLGTAPTDWACTKENKTGLIWEVKTDDDGLRDKDWTYSWYEPDASKSGDYPSLYEYKGWCKGNDCDTYAFTNAVNAEGLCGATNWRMPSEDELSGIKKSSATNPSIDTAYFPNTQSHFFWSSSSYNNLSNYAWVVDFYGSYSGSGGYKGGNYNVRLVR